MIKWKEKKFNQVKIKYIYVGADEQKLIKIILNFYKKRNKTIFFKHLNQLSGFFAFYVILKNEKIACVDRVRSFPILFERKKKKNFFFFGEKILLIKNKDNNLYNLDTFKKTGYVLGNGTLKKNLYQITAGQIYFSEENKFYEYFSFKKNEVKKNKIKLFVQLNQILNQTFDKIKISFKNYKIILPLSGGMDSRLVLCKLLEKKFNNLLVISYGKKNNFDHLRAEKICKKLKLNYKYINISRKFAKENFDSDLRKKYWKYSNNFTSLPNMQEFLILKYLKDKNLISNKTLFLNGQSGDQLTGNHIPNIRSKRKMIEEILNKNFSLNEVLKNFNEDRKKINQQYKIFNNIPLDFQYFWEWRERQSKYVVNQQRVYEFFKCSWYLPLWDNEISIFFKNLPISYLLKQKFYKEFLQFYNYKNLFSKDLMENKKTNWTKYQTLIRYPAFIIGMIFGKKAKNIFYKIFQYFNLYNFHYYCYDYFFYLKKINSVRNPNSLFLETFLIENNYLKK